MENSKLDQNVCRDVEVNDLFHQVENPLQAMFDEQFRTQAEDYGYNWDEVKETVGSVKGFIDWNYGALQDELREMYSALGGVDTHGSAAWKPWKSKFKETQQKPMSSLTEHELKELQMEVVDAWKFMMNITLAVDLDAQKLFNMFMGKGAENIKRQQSGTY